jgi:hypothetical protein
MPIDDELVVGNDNENQNQQEETVTPEVNDSFEVIGNSVEVFKKTVINSRVERLSDNEIYDTQSNEPSSLSVVSTLNLTKGAEIDLYSNTVLVQNPIVANMPSCVFVIDSETPESPYTEVIRIYGGSNLIATGLGTAKILVGYTIKGTKIIDEIFVTVDNKKTTVEQGQGQGGQQNGNENGQPQNTGSELTTGGEQQQTTGGEQQQASGGSDAGAESGSVQTPGNELP